MCGMEAAYEVSIISDFESLISFSCGIQPLDEFIHSELEIYSKNHYCSAYSVSTKNRSDDVVALSDFIKSVISQNLLLANKVKCGQCSEHYGAMNNGSLWLNDSDENSD